MSGPPFVGRAGELARLRRELDLAGPGPGRVVLVSADPGVGKTRLVQEFAARIGSRALVLVGRGSPLAGTVPLAILAEPLDVHLAALPQAQRQRLTGGRALLDLLAEHTGEHAQLRRFAAVRRLLSALAADRPVVLILDDVHQADRSSWELIGYLGRNSMPAPVLLIAAARAVPLTEEPDLAATVGALARDRLAGEVRLEPFGAAQLAELATAVLGPDGADAGLVGWLHERAGGNPLFTVALLEQVAADPGRRGEVPTGVRQRVRQMRAMLTGPVRDVLDLSAVLGHAFPAATIAALAGPGAAGALDRLVGERILVERPDGYDFAHPLLQEAAYEALGVARRRELHDRVGGVLVAAPLAVRAYHLARGALPGDLDAVAVLREAARDATRSQAHREALGHLRAALELTPRSAAGTRLELLDETAWLAAAAADHVTGIGALTELAGLVADDPLRLAQARMRLASFLSTGAADVAAADRAASTAVELLRGADAGPQLAAALNERAWIRGMGGDFAGQLAGCREALEIAEAGGADATVVLHIVGPLGAVTAMRGDFAAARPLHARATRLAAATGHPHQIGWHAAVAYLTELFAGRFSAAAAIVDPAVDPAPLDADIATPWRTLVDWFLGRWETGRADCAVVGEMFPATPSAHMAWALSMAGLFATVTGGGGEASLGQASRTYGDRDLYFFTALHHWAAGTVRWLRADLDAAATHLHRSARWLAGTGAVGFEGLLLAELPEVLVQLGEAAGARRAAERATEIDRRLRTPFSAAQAAYTQALVAPRGPAAAAAFEAAAKGYAAVSAPFLRARALEHQAEVVPGRRLDLLGEAARLYTALPAPRHAERVLAALRAAGPAGQRAAQHAGALTAREVEIAALAARGLSTADIAARLHLSTRTVETHLGRVYRKLGIDRRSRLADALGG